MTDAPNPSTTRQVIGSLIAAILLVAAVVALVAWRIGPGGVQSEPREEHLEEAADEEEDAAEEAEDVADDARDEGRKRRRGRG